MRSPRRPHDRGAFRASLLPATALLERRYSGLARRLVAVRCAAYVAGRSPGPAVRHDGVKEENTADHDATFEYVVIVIAPLI
jgi:hypothetical protein